jgi:hypothetical protein
MLARTVLHALFKAIRGGAVPRNAAETFGDILVRSFVCNKHFVWFLKVDQHASWRTTIELTFHTGN